MWQFDTNKMAEKVIKSGVAGPLAARGGGQICRPFVLGFGNWIAGKHKSQYDQML